MDSFGFSRRRRLPIIVSAEAAECGLTCLAMVAAWHGHDVNLNGLRQRFSLSLTGATMRSLMGLADQIGLAPRAVKADLEHIKQLKLPAILHWDLNHFVVLKSIGRRQVTIHDPGYGAKSLSWAEISNHYTGVALELTPSASFRPEVMRTQTSLANLWSGVTGVWESLGTVLALSAMLQIAAFASPFFLQLVVDEVVLRADRELLVVLALGFGAIALFQVAMEALRNWSLLMIGASANLQITSNLVRHLLRLPSSFFEKRHLGDILSRLGSARAIQEVITKGAAAAVIDGAMALAAVTVMFVYSSTLALVVVASIVLILAIHLAAFPIMRRRNQAQLNEAAKEQSQLMETVRAATMIKLMGREAERAGAWRNSFAKAAGAQVSVGRWQISVALLQQAIVAIQTILIIYLGTLTILRGSGFSVGMLFAFLSFRQTFTDRTTALVAQAIQFRFLGLHLERLDDVVASPVETPLLRVPLDPSAVAGSIVLRGVSFAYGATDRRVLDGIDLTVRGGEYVAITGPSGGGKSTLAKVMLGLAAPTSGYVELEGQVARPELWQAWREHVGVVWQDDCLLSGSIAENIAFFDPNLDMRRVAEAATLAQLGDDIARMPMQFMSLIGDMGSSLSGGQRQRVLLARALYRRPRVLVLDEGTANLDVVTEETIADLVRSLPITRIVIAHRPALLERADRVLTLRAGKFASAVPQPEAIN